MIANPTKVRAEGGDSELFSWTFAACASVDEVQYVDDDGSLYCVGCRGGKPGCALDGHVAPGYWVPESYGAQPWQCLVDSSCRGFVECDGGNATCAAQQCAAGHTGALCAVCQPGYGLTLSGECKSCAGWSSVSVTALLSLLIVCVGLYLAVLVVRHSLDTSDSARAISTIKIMANYFMFLSVLKSFALDWGGMLDTLFVWMGVASGGGLADVQMFSCAFDMPIFSKYLVYFLIPVFIVVAPAAGLAVYVLAYKVKVVWGVSPRFVYRQSLLVLFYFAYSTIVSISLRVLHCTEVDGKWLLLDDMATECAGATYASYRAAAIAYLCTLVPGIPVSIVAIMRWRNFMAKPKWRRQFFIFYGDYEPEYHYWEAFVMFRKASITAVAVLLGNDRTGWQVYLGTWLLLLSFSAQMAARPQRNTLQLVLETASQATVLASLLLGQAISYSASSEDGFRVAVLVLNVAVVSVMAYVLAKEMAAELREARARLKAKIANPTRRLSSLMLAKMGPSRSSRSAAAAAGGGLGAIIEGALAEDDEDYESSDEDEQATSDVNMVNPLMVRRMERGEFDDVIRDKEAPSEIAQANPMALRDPRARARRSVSMSGDSGGSAASAASVDSVDPVGQKRRSVSMAAAARRASMRVASAARSLSPSAGGSAEVEIEMQGASDSEPQRRQSRRASMLQSLRRSMSVTSRQGEGEAEGEAEVEVKAAGDNPMALRDPRTRERLAALEQRQQEEAQAPPKSRRASMAASVVDRVADQSRRASMRMASAARSLSPLSRAKEQASEPAEIELQAAGGSQPAPTEPEPEPETEPQRRQSRRASMMQSLRRSMSVTSRRGEGEGEGEGEAEVEVKAAGDNPMALRDPRTRERLAALEQRQHEEAQAPPKSRRASMAASVVDQGRRVADQSRRASMRMASAARSLSPLSRAKEQASEPAEIELQAAGGSLPAPTEAEPEPEPQRRQSRRASMMQSLRRSMSVTSRRGEGEGEDKGEAEAEVEVKAGNPMALRTQERLAELEQAPPKSRRVSMAASVVDQGRRVADQSRRASMRMASAARSLSPLSRAKEQADEPAEIELKSQSTENPLNAVDTNRDAARLRQMSAMQRQRRRSSVAGRGRGRGRGRGVARRDTTML